MLLMFRSRDLEMTGTLFFKSTATLWVFVFSSRCPSVCQSVSNISYPPFFAFYRLDAHRNLYWKFQLPILDSSQETHISTIALLTD